MTGTKIQAGSPYLVAAIAVANELVETAIREPSGMTWQGDDLLGDDEASVRVVRGGVGPHLYGGTAGIGWFLGHLAAYTQDKRMAAVAVAALRFALVAAKSRTEPRSVSLFSGAAGIALAAVEVGACLRHPALSREGLMVARSIAKMLQPGSDTHEHTDLLGGLAGTVIGLLAMYRRAPDAVLLEACRRACNRILEARHQDGFGTSWPQHDGAAPAPGLCGLGHGASGIAWALAELDWVNGNAHLPAAVDGALVYERAWFSPDRCAWADLRQPSLPVVDNNWPAWTTAWCHGALGIGALRLRIYEVTRDLTALAEGAAAIQAARGMVGRAGSALRQSQTTDVTLCHGLGGAIELMLMAYEITGMPDHQRAARRAGDLCLTIHRANLNRWTLGLAQAGSVPGLFLGLTGIGVTMMRLHDPALIGSPILPGRLPFRKSTASNPVPHSGRREAVSHAAGSPRSCGPPES